MNLLQLTNDALERCNYNTVTTLASGATVPSTRMVRFLNQWHRKIIADQMFTRIRDGQLTFASVASQSLYGLPPTIQKIKRIYETTNNTRLRERSGDWLKQDPQGLANLGTPDCYVPIGVTAITRQPASTGLWAASTSAADTTQTVSVNAVRAGGYLHTPAPKTLNGVTRVALGTTPLTDYVDVLKCWLSAACAGDVSLYDAASLGNVLATIPTGKTYSRYFSILLWPTPSAALTYYVDHERQIQDMALDTDEPLWPEDFHHVLVSAAVYQELVIKKDPNTAGIYFKNEVKPGLDSLLSFLVNHDDYIVVPDDHRRHDARGSNLGSWFPSGRW